MRGRGNITYDVRGAGTTGEKAMSDVIQWVDEALTEGRFNYVRLDAESAAIVVDRAREIFVEGDPRVWWLGLKLPVSARSSRDCAVADIMPVPSTKVFFIPEDDVAELSVYELSTDAIEYLRQNAALFEYYVVPESYAWLICESDHDEFLLCLNTQE